ncbi:HNH endonuclease [Flavobacteriaceae bacterium KMM 6898]|nr:HNH endonuclease [Flavobacteriaceae bacterium KMM 6898]
MEKLTFRNITRIKHITNNEVGRAYLDLKEKIFNLKYPLRQKKNILDPNTDELIVLYQKIGGSNTRYVTHLVRPVDNQMTDDGDRDNFKFGRFVELISYPGEENKINFKNTELTQFNFNNRGWGKAEKLNNIITNPLDLENVQKSLWNMFLPYMETDLVDNSNSYHNFLNDELNEDFETEEGKELFRKHRILERDSRITKIKKENALKAGNLHCEVCTFSFQKRFNQNYIECHHKVPIHLGARITRLEDLALVCSNCHRMLHRKIDGKYLSIKELKKLIGI